MARRPQRRQGDFRKARRLGKNDGLFVWTKGCQQSEILSANEGDLLPAQITVRIVRFTTTIRGFRHRRITLVTSLLDPELSPAEELAAKELLAYLVAHNLVRCVMAEAVAAHRGELERVSFKGSLDAWRQFSDVMSRAPNRKLRRQLWADLLLALARDWVPLRPNRTEPRAVKRRPKPFPLLNNPRRKFVEISHRSRYWKGRPRNYRGLI